MFQFNRKVEYALAIVAHMTLAGREQLHSARSIAEHTRIPFDMVTKCLQRLHKRGLCQAVQGKHGGYRLTADPTELTVGGFIAAVFEPVAVADCIAKPSGSECQLLGDCQLQAPMERLNQRVTELLDSFSLADFLGLQSSQNP